MKNNNIDTVCFEENCLVNNKILQILKLPGKGDNVRKKGEDIKKIRLLLKKEEKSEQLTLLSYLLLV